MASGCLAERAPQEGALSRNAKVRKILFTQSLFSFFFSIFFVIYATGQAHQQSFINLETLTIATTFSASSTLSISFYVLFPCPKLFVCTTLSFPTSQWRIPYISTIPPSVPPPFSPDHNTMLLPSTRTGTHDEPFSSFLITS